MGNTVIEDIKKFLLSKEPVARLIAINITVFVLLGLLLILTNIIGTTWLYSSVLNVLAVDLSFYGVLTAPWTVFTYMFVHTNLMHLFWTCITLYWFGQIFTYYTAPSKIAPLYILGGMFGVIFSLLLYQLNPNNSYTLVNQMFGASASVTAIVVATAALVPHYKMNLMFIGPVKLLYIAAFFVFISILNASTSSNIGGNLSHIGGALFGFFFTQQYKKGNDLTIIINNTADKIARFFSAKVSNNNSYHTPKRPMSDKEYNEQKVSAQARIDEILDKISKSGYDSLSKEEKSTLFKESNKG